MNISEWSRPHFSKKGDVHVWQFDLSGVDGLNFKSVLSVDEIARSRKYRFEKDRECFIRSRGLLRWVLGFYLKSKAQDIVLSYTDQGKPHISRAFLKSAPLYFNLSHSENILLCAFSEGGEVGVDVEWVDVEVDWESVAEYFYALSEIQALRALPREHQCKSFFQSWTHKEALAKAQGGGELFSRLLSPSVMPASETVWEINQSKKLSAEGCEFESRALPVFPGFVAALSAKRDSEQIVLYDFSSGASKVIAF